MLALDQLGYMYLAESTCSTTCTVWQAITVPSNANSTSSMGEGDTGAASQLQVGAAAVASAAIAIAAMIAAMVPG